MNVKIVLVFDTLRNDDDEGFIETPNAVDGNSSLNQSQADIHWYNVILNLQFVNYLALQKMECKDIDNIKRERTVLAIVGCGVLYQHCLFYAILVSSLMDDDDRITNSADNVFSNVMWYIVSKLLPFLLETVDIIILYILIILNFILCSINMNYIVRLL